MVDPLDEPFRPEVGGLYWVDTVIIWSGDRKPSRPVVVLEVPPRGIGRILMVTRTSDVARTGVYHEAMPEIGLNKPGVFGNLASAEASLWTRRNVEYLGALPSATFDKIMSRYG
jgi:hypothetical protein